MKKLKILFISMGLFLFTSFVTNAQHRSGYLRPSYTTHEHINTHVSNSHQSVSYRGYQNRGYQNVNVNRRGYFRQHDWYSRHNYYNTYYFPHIGFGIGVLPYGYYPFWYDNYQYYYSNGLYYMYNNDQYIVVDPPIGAEISVLPTGAETVDINGEQYYELNGVYYQPYDKNGTQMYIITGKDGDTSGQDIQIGYTVTKLPDNCDKVKINGQKLYVSPDGVYYQKINDNLFKVVGKPSDDE